MKQIWWEFYLFYLGFESELKYYLPNLNWVLATITFCVLLILLVLLERKLYRKISALTVVFVTTLAFYLSFILCVTLFGRSPSSISSWDTLLITYQKAVVDDPGARTAVFFNMVLFFPLGLLISRYKKTSICILFLLALTVIIEIIQLITSVGVFEICDIINNFVGGLIGLGVARLISFLFTHIKDKRKGDRVERAQ